MATAAPLLTILIHRWLGTSRLSGSFSIACENNGRPLPFPGPEGAATTTNLRPDQLFPGDPPLRVKTTVGGADDPPLAFEDRVSGPGPGALAKRGNSTATACDPGSVKRHRPATGRAQSGRHQRYLDAWPARCLPGTAGTTRERSRSGCSPIRLAPRACRSPKLGDSPSRARPYACDRSLRTGFW